MLFRQIADDGLSQYAYLIGCQRTGEALIVDPERDVDRYFAAAAAEGLRLTAATETHIHADFLSGARELAMRGVPTSVSDAGSDPAWKYEWPASDGTPVRLLRNGDVVTVGAIELRVVHTPGHTPEHISFLVTDRGAGADVPLGIITGDFVFVGDVGRPDLLETAAGVAGSQRPAAETLGRSLRAFAELPERLLVWPGHGAGSACGKALGAVPMSTVGYERRLNAALRTAIDEPDRFADAILDGQPEPPPYFAAMKRWNRLGPPLLTALPAPPRLDPSALALHAGAPGTVTIDTRAARTEFMSAHLKGSLFAPLDRGFSTVVGSYVAEHEAVLLVVAPERVEEAVRRLVRIGIDRIEGYATPEDLRQALAVVPPAAIQTFDCDAMRGVDPTFVVVDVRSAAEYHASHVPGAVNIPYTRLLRRLGELPRNRPLVVHCASGARAAVAVAALERHGFDVRYVNDSCVGR